MKLFYFPRKNIFLTNVVTNPLLCPQPCGYRGYGYITCYGQSVILRKKKTVLYPRSLWAEYFSEYLGRLTFTFLVPPPHKISKFSKNTNCIIELRTSQYFYYFHTQQRVNILNILDGHKQQKKKQSNFCKLRTFRFFYQQ